MKKINIHFVCRGNIYRSRLAEAYLKSFQNAAWGVSSSGIGATKHAKVHISPWTEMLAVKNDIKDWLSETNIQTSQEVLDGSDLIVFMNKDVYQDAKKSYEFNEDKTLVWHVKDREDWPEDMIPKNKRRKTFDQIKKSVDQFIKDITAGGNWVDIVDERNQEMGFSLPVTFANHKGLWHRGCHVVVTTPDKKTLVQQRSKNIYFSPGMLDISLGGHVDTGETPEQAMKREIKEEMGLSVEQSDLHLLTTYKWNRYHPQYKIQQKAFVSIYCVVLKENNPTIVFQKEEVEAAIFLSPKQLQWLIRFHRLIGGARLANSYAYFAKIVGLTQDYLNKSAS
jgi:protein-tyrosine-phosphatase/8-oxo-dGTP pyrophosphatase MutT (NUDIX family)